MCGSDQKIIKIKEIQDPKILDFALFLGYKSLGSNSHIDLSFMPKVFEEPKIKKSDLPNLNNLLTSLKNNFTVS